MEKVFATRNKPGMFRTRYQAVRFILGTVVMAVVVLAAGVGLWKGVGRGISLAQANPVDFHMACVSAFFAICCLALTTRRFLSYSNWGYWAWGTIIFAGISAQSFFTMGGV